MTYPASMSIFKNGSAHELPQKIVTVEDQVQFEPAIYS